LFEQSELFLNPYKKERKMKIYFINNEGAGFADEVNVDPGKTIAQFLSDFAKNHSTDPNPEAHVIRVNREPTPADYVLQNGDRVSITPSKIEGA
jgi:sulfur carrier protein ThiS